MSHCNNGSHRTLERLSTPSRNHYFYGKLLDAYHLEMEQDYFNGKRWLLNRLALGYGVLCGLDVSLVDETDGEQRIVVRPGVAIDGLGREIVVPTPSRSINPRQLTDECGRPEGEPLSDEQAAVVWICLAYHECEEDLVPVLVGDCDADECAPSTICERYRVLVLQDEEFEAARPGCPASVAWNRIDGELTEESYGTLVDLVSDSCPSSERPYCVPIARVSFPAAGEPTVNANVRPVLMSNERLLELMLCLEAEEGEEPTPEPELTTIVDISWPHGEEVHLGTFTDGLTVTFSDTITATADPGEAWFVVTIEQPVTENMGWPPWMLPGFTSIRIPAVISPSVDGGGAGTAIFSPDEDFTAFMVNNFSELRVDRLLCRVVLKCDFLVDTDGRAVDGNHLRGERPTGDGVPGGDFESWFYLTMDEII